MRQGSLLFLKRSKIYFQKFLRKVMTIKVNVRSPAQHLAMTTNAVLLVLKPKLEL